MNELDEFPQFTKEASCANAPEPDMWFPERVPGMRDWSYTPSAKLARSICDSCPARLECLDYALTFSNLDGIWGGLDPDERARIQQARNLAPKPMRYVRYLSTIRGVE